MSTPSTDALVSRFLDAGDGAEAERLLAEILAGQVEPLVRRILLRRMGAAPFGHGDRTRMDDVRGQVVVRILGRLRTLKSVPQHERIRNFENYVAVATYRAYYEHLRERYPERHRLKNRLRYVLTHAPGLAFWEDDEGRWLTGLAGWRDRSWEGITLAVAREPLPGVECRWRDQPVQFLLSLFASVQAPVEFEDLVRYLADAEGIRGPGRYDCRVANDVVADPDAVAQAQDRVFLQQLWVEICRLPVRQRRALLLTLSDPQGRDLIGFLPLTGTASQAEIARTLEMAPAELAALWPDLPLDDQALATGLGVTRQQVVNLRVAARRRLARRMKLRPVTASRVPC
jgi:hypothetical protein